MTYALKNMYILSGHEDMEPVSGKAIIVEEGKIRSVIDEDKLPSDMKTVDLEGGYLLPGLVNLHLHIPGSAKPKKKPMNYAIAGKLLKSRLVCAVYKKICEANVKDDLLSGSTTIRAVGGLPGFDTEIRNKINDGKLQGPRILTADYAVSVPGGHMTGSVALPANSVEEAEKMVDEIAKGKPDLIKVMITGGVLDSIVPGEPGVLKMPAEYVKAICDRAHSYGLKVAAHVEGTEGMEIALKNGVDTIEHGGKPDENTVALFKETGASLIATLSPAMAFADMTDNFIGVSEIGHVNGVALYKNMRECVRQCREAGVTVGLGTDTGCPYVTHYDFWREVWYYHMLCGVSCREALYTATLLNARIAGISDVTGSVDEGKYAEFVVVKEDPLKDLKALRAPSKVIFRDDIIDDPRPRRIKAVDETLDDLMSRIEEKIY